MSTGVHGSFSGRPDEPAAIASGQPGSGPAPAWTMNGIGGLPPMLRLPEAARLLGIGRTNAYRLAQEGQFPVPVMRIGKQYRIPTAGLLTLLGMTVPTSGDHASPETVDFHP